MVIAQTPIHCITAEINAGNRVESRLIKQHRHMAPKKHMF